MPRVHLTLKERQDAERRKTEEKQNRELRAVLHDKIYRKINYDEICEKTQLSRPTVVKVINHPEKATIPQLRAICAAADIALTIAGE